MIDINIYEKIGSLIRETREQLNISQKDLADKAGFDTATAISLIESGKRKVSIEVLKKISDALNKKVDFFLSDSEKKELHDKEDIIAYRGKELSKEQRDDVLNYIEFIKSKKNGK